MAGDPQRKVLAAFLTGSVLAGGNAVSIRFSNRELDPMWGAGLRFTLATLLLVAAALVLRVPWPRGRAMAGAAVFGLFNFGLAFALGYFALVRIHAGVFQTVTALTPLATLLLAVGQGQERLRTQALVGTGLAVAGVAIVTRGGSLSSVPLSAIAAMLGGVLCFGEAAVLARRLPRCHPVTMTATGMATGAAFLLAASLVKGESHTVPTRAETWTALAYLVVMGSVVVFVLYLFVLNHWVASRAAFTFVIVPIVTVVLSARLDHEPITTALLVGAPLVLAGVYVGAVRPGAGPPGPVAGPRHQA